MPNNDKNTKTTQRILIIAALVGFLLSGALGATSSIVSGLDTSTIVSISLGSALGGGLSSLFIYLCATMFCHRCIRNAPRIVPEEQNPTPTPAFITKINLGQLRTHSPACIRHEPNVINRATTPTSISLVVAAPKAIKTLGIFTENEEKSELTQLPNHTTAPSFSSV